MPAALSPGASARGGGLRGGGAGAIDDPQNAPKSDALQRVHDRRVHACQAQRATEAHDACVAADQLTEAVAINKRHRLQIQHDPFASPFNQSPDRVPEVAMAFTRRDASGHHEHRAVSALVIERVAFFNRDGHGDTKRLREVRAAGGVNHHARCRRPFKRIGLVQTREAACYTPGSFRVREGVQCRGSSVGRARD